MLALRINRLNGDWDDYWAAFAANFPLPKTATGQRYHRFKQLICATLVRPRHIDGLAGHSP